LGAIVNDCDAPEVTVTVPEGVIVPPDPAEAVIENVATELIVRLSVADPVPPALFALIVTLEVPAALGVPEINPLDVFTDSPAGSPLALKLVGVLLAVIW
jgi:hypothetical protein